MFTVFVVLVKRVAAEADENVIILASIYGGARWKGSSWLHSNPSRGEQACVYQIWW